MKFVNLTPHAVVIIAGPNQHTIAPSGQLARVSVTSVSDGEIDGIPISRTEYGEITGLPDPQDGVIYIVGALVGARVTGREDVLGPDTNKAIRDEAGQIIGVPGLVRFV